MENDPIELTEKEKLECAVKWLNRLWYGFVLEEPPKMACDDCSLWLVKCKRKKHNVMPCLEHFKVLEQFTGEGTVAGLRIGSGL
jgi:hypothetical protein